MTKPLWLSVLMVLVFTGAWSPADADPATAGPAAPERTASTTMSADHFETRLLARTNARREARGCRPLRLNAALVAAARQHSALMANQDELSHQLPGEAGLVGRVEAVGYTNWRLVAENLAWGESTPRAVFRDWLHSAGHRANLDNCRFRDIGVGVVVRGGEPWVTEDFGRRAR